MPTEEQIVVVREQVIELTGLNYRGFTEWKDGRLLCEWFKEIDWVDGKDGTQLRSWVELDEHALDHVLRGYVRWQGFEEQDKRQVIANIVDGKDVAKCMDGICFDRHEYESIASPAETRELFAEWTMDFALRSMPESVRDSIPTESLSTLEAVMEAVGNSQMPESIRVMQDEYYRSLASRSTPAVEPKSAYDRMMEEAASKSKSITRSEEGIER